MADKQGVAIVRAQRFVVVGTLLAVRVVREVSGLGTPPKAALMAASTSLSVGMSHLTPKLSGWPTARASRLWASPLKRRGTRGVTRPCIG